MELDATALHFFYQYFNGLSSGLVGDGNISEAEKISMINPQLFETCKCSLLAPF